MTKGKWKREVKADDDKFQTKLDSSSPSLLEVKEQPKITIIDKYVDEYLCPFCLHKDRISAYLISTKKGYHKGLGLCPECGNKMQLKTLTANMNAEQYAEFVYRYSVQGFWQKVNFETFNYRLRKYGLLLRFWARYKQLKGTKEQKSYADHMEEAQEQWAKEQGLMD